MHSPKDSKTRAKKRERERMKKARVEAGDDPHEGAVESFRNRMSAAQCKEHRWLARKPGKQQQVEQTVPMTKRSVIPKQILEISRVQDTAAEELDVAKDNLRLFVERWREHPDSPYLIESPQWAVPRRSWVLEESMSLGAQSPSPCASICSTPSEPAESFPQDSQGFLRVPSFGLSFERRASEGVAVEKNRSDAASQIVLAEEIIKLSEHLRAIAMGTTMKSSEEDTRPSNLPVQKTEKPKDQREARGNSNQNGVRRSNGLVAAESTECNEITEKLSSIVRHRKINGTTFHSNRSFDKYSETNSGNMFATLKRGRQNADRNVAKKEDDRISQEEANSSAAEAVETDESLTSSESLRIPDIVQTEMDLTPPWRRSRVKHLFGETSRDVPRISGLRNVHKSLNLDEPTSTKDLLLHLLEEWDEVATRPSGVGRKSVSVDWGGEESVARKTMNSLAEYFQSKQKQSTSSGDSATQNSIHRWWMFVARIKGLCRTCLISLPWWRLLSRSSQGIPGTRLIITLDYLICVVFEWNLYIAKRIRYLRYFSRIN